jgi:hypothetical protein
LDVFICVIGIIIILLCFKIEERKKYKINKVKGDVGENIVANKLKQLDDKFEVYNNVYFEKYQIDHLVINHSCKLIFVIETKMWGGIITGKANNDQWQQNKNGKIQYFNNPVLQNRYHCNVIRRYYKRYKIYNIVVFVKNKNVPFSNCVMNEYDLIEYIKKVYNRVYNRCIMNV